MPWLDELIRDVRVGFRSLARDPVVAVSATLILGLGVGATVAMFSVLNAIVLRPLPYARSGELARLTTHLIRQNQPDGTSVPNLLDWRRQSRSFAAMTFYRRTSVSTITFAGTDSEILRAQEGLVGPEFFDVLGAAPLMGRTFTREEFERRERLVVVSEGFWQQQLARSGDALGRTLTIDAQPHVVIGVMPRTFQLPTGDTRFWRPLSVSPWWAGAGSARDADGIEVLGRLAPNVRLDDARAEMNLIAGRLREAYPSNANLDIQVFPLLDHIVSARTRRGVWIGFGAVISLLGIACANVAGLLSARAVRRRRELAVRAALGAGRGRLVRHLLAESVSLWAMASAGGLLLAYGAIRLLVAYGPALPRMEQVALDGSTLAAALLGGLVVVALCGTVPALVAMRTDAAAGVSTRDQSGLPRRRLHDLLVSAQVAGAVMLLIGAVLLAQSFMRAVREAPGYPAQNLLIVRIDLPRAGYPGRPNLLAFLRDARNRLSGLPGVVAVGGIGDFFLRRNADQKVTVETRIAESSDAAPRLSIETVTPGYFTAAGIEIVDGREFIDQDLEGEAPTAFVANETMARKLWPGERAVGKRIVGGGAPPKDGHWSVVVGVVRDMRRESLDAAPIMSAFVPAYLRGMDLTIRASSDVENLIPAVRREIRAIDGALPITQVAAVQARLAERLGGRRFEAQVLGVFAAIALLLSAVGVYALLAYQVDLRTREIGIRSALGADRQAIVAMILGRGVRLAVIGAAIGIVGAVGAARIIQSLLYQTAAMHAPSYAAAAGFVLLVATAASYVPARRAARLSPLTALRDE